MLRVPMTPEAEARWRAELRLADAIIETEIIPVDEDIDEYLPKAESHEAYLRQRGKVLASEELHQQAIQRSRDYRKNNLEKCKATQRNWYQRHKDEVARKRKAARLLEQSHGAKEITDTRIISGREGEVNA